jgi:hypothetical protein
MNERDNSDRRLPPGFVREIMDSMAEMSGLVFWRVTGTWASNGRTGKIDDIVEAKTATEAIAIAWACEDDRDLRTIHAEWLCPIESVKRDDSESRRVDGEQCTTGEAASGCDARDFDR